MPMHCILQPGLPETNHAYALYSSARPSRDGGNSNRPRKFLYSHDRYLFYIHIHIYDFFLVLTKRISEKGCMDDI